MGQFTPIGPWMWKWRASGQSFQDQKYVQASSRPPSSNSNADVELLFECAVISMQFVTLLKSFQEQNIKYITQAPVL